MIYEHNKCQEIQLTHCGKTAEYKRLIIILKATSEIDFYNGSMRILFQLSKYLINEKLRN